MKGRKAGQIRAPVKAIMTRQIISVTCSSTIREIERIFYKYNVSQILVIENNSLMGIITRWDYLQMQKQGNWKVPENSAIDTLKQYSTITEDSIVGG
jgi:predicted transcriptional regulator